MMVYEDFRNHLTEFLWKTSDQDLINNLDNLIKMADGALNTALNFENTDTIVVPVERNTVLLPDTFSKLRSVAIEYERSIVELKYVTIPRLMSMSKDNPHAFHPYFSIQDKVIFLAGPFGGQETTTPPILIVTHGSKLPKFAELNASWFADEHLALYTYAVLVHASAFLREDERVPLWQQQYDRLLSKLTEQTAMFGNIGVSGDMPLPRLASPIRRTSYNKARK